MSENFMQSLVLTGAGMGMVFCFLVILVYATKWTGSIVCSLESKFGSIVKPDAVKTKPAASAGAAAPKQDMSEIAAVLAIACKEYGL
ncbi:MAG: OadG family protein [bacterium]|nr:OadG family protein [bacterium]